MPQSGDHMDHDHSEDEAKYLSTITEKEEADRTSAVSYTSTSTVFSSTSDRENSFVAQKTPQIDIARSNQLPGDILFLPLNIQTPIDGSFPENPLLTNIPSRGISRISIPISQLQGTQPSLLVPAEAKSVTPQALGITPLQPPPGFQPVRPGHEASPQPANVHLAPQSATTRTTSAECHVAFDTPTTTIELQKPLASPSINSPSTKNTALPSPTPPWPLPLPEQSPSMSDTSGQESHFTDLPSYPGTPGSRFSWNVKTQARARSWFTRWFVEWWMFEILSWIFSVICISTVVIVLIYFNGRELPQWKLGITINAFIAIFAGFAKSALLVPTAEALGQLKWDWYRSKPKKMMDFEILDSASRGPWGSLVLLTRTKGITLASVGAAVILLSLPLDLFFQQIVSFPTVSVLQSSNATVGRAVYYNPETAAQVWYGTVTYRADWTMENAVIANIYKRPWDMQVEYVCPTNNCTWEPFYTMAVRGSCQEMPSSFLELGCHEVSGQWMSDVVPDPTIQDNIIPNVTTCGWYLNPPDAPRELMSGYSVGNNSKPGEALMTRLFPLRDQFTRNAIYGGSINYKKYTKTTIQDFLIVASPGGAAGAYRNATPVIHECELHWTVERTQSAAVEGILQEYVTEVLDLDVIETGETDGDNPWITMGWYGLNFSKTLSDPGSSASLDFGMANLTARKTIQALEEVIPATVTADNANALPVAKTFWRGDMPDPRALEDTLNPWLPPMNASEYIAGIARAMTIAARRTGDITNTQFDQVTGKVWDDRTLIRVKWVWISLPVALLLTSLVFLVATIARSSKEESSIGVWKTSALAVLFNGLGQDVQEQPGAHDRLGQARSKAKNLEVTLEK